MDDEMNCVNVEETDDEFTGEDYQSQEYKKLSWFLNKLWKLVNSKVTDSSVKWSSNGKSFYVTDKVNFCEQVLPAYFKHKNFASFVRQLNIYGFTKMCSKKWDSCSIQTKYSGRTEFTHENFVRNRLDLLFKIQRKKKDVKEDDGAVLRTLEETLSRVVKINDDGETTRQNSQLISQNIKTINGNQSILINELKRLKHQNKIIWSELVALRNQHKKQQDFMTHVFEFLISSIKSNKTIVNSDINNQSSILDTLTYTDEISSKKNMQLTPLNHQKLHSPFDTSMNLKDFNSKNQDEPNNRAEIEFINSEYPEIQNNDHAMNLIMPTELIEPKPQEIDNIIDDNADILLEDIWDINNYNYSDFIKECDDKF
ncbi:Heat stress transcription factor [Intoshia linei]|uniref:Heat stress transcription factor n=1 Tax=Intoshia linei TaxID=1819745 RepID=A0A177B003_9BILA|nr:Heat stress transcription factor [Intoshia linei]